MASNRFLNARGGALLLTLWCIAVLSLTVVLLAQIVSSDVDSESIRARRFEARELALTGIAYGMNPVLKRDSELFHQKFADGTALDVQIASEGSRLNINRLLKEEEQPSLKSLFSIWNIPSTDTGAVIDSLVDWTDIDGLRQLNGAERDDLIGQTTYSLPKNRDFRSVDEMKRVRGMDVVEQDIPNWKDFFSVYSGQKVAVQDAAPPVLQALAGLSRAQCADLQKWRNGPDDEPGTADDHLIKSVDEVTERLGLTGAQAEAFRAAFEIGGEPSRIISTGRVGGIQYRIVVVVNRGSGANGFLLWEEG